MKTKKVMYNDCYGGFGISGFAKIEYAKRVLHEPFKVYSDAYSDKELTEAEIAELSEEPNLHSIGITDFANNYKKCCDELKKVNLYECEWKGKKSYFGGSWFHWDIPAEDIEKIKELIKNHQS